MSVKQKYVSQLNTLDKCQREAARLYAEARRYHGEAVNADVGFKLCSMLREVARLIEQSEIEQRLQRLEAAAPQPRRLAVA